MANAHLKAYILAVTGGHKGAFNLCDLDLNNTDQVKDALCELQDDGEIVLYRNDDNMDREGRSFEIDCGGAPRHMLYRVN